MNDYIWDIRANVAEKGDNLREVLALRSYEDESKVTHYVFSKAMFNNPKYVMPENELELFKSFLEGGSREYPSDGNIPVDVAAGEARIVLEKIEEIANNPDGTCHENARKALRNGKVALVRGTIKLYLGEYTTRDWRRKRFTDDIDFWLHDKTLLEHVLKKTNWTKNKKTREWEKTVEWNSPRTNRRKSGVLIASDDLDQLLDFGSGSYLDGSSLKDIFKKKLKIGRDVDLSDIINVAIVNNKTESDDLREGWNYAWKAFEESANMRGMRVTSNMISLCRFSYGVADYLERVGKVIGGYKEKVLDKSDYSDDKIIRVCRCSSHLLRNDRNMGGVNATRTRIYLNLVKQEKKKKQYAKNLRGFADSLLKLLNSKYESTKVVFEIEK